jgi:hypothetical protein
VIILFLDVHGLQIYALGILFQDKTTEEIQEAKTYGIQAIVNKEKATVSVGES